MNLNNIKFILDSEGESHPCPDHYISLVHEDIDFEMSRVDEINASSFKEFVTKILNYSYHTVAEETLNDFVDMSEDEKYVETLLDVWLQKAKDLQKDSSLDKKRRELASMLDYANRCVPPSVYNHRVDYRLMIISEHIKKDECIKIYIKNPDNFIKLEIFSYVSKNKDANTIRKELKELLCIEHLQDKLFKITHNIKEKDIEYYHTNMIKSIILEIEYLSAVNAEQIRCTNNMIQRLHNWRLEYL